MPTLFYKGPECRQLKTGTMITVVPKQGHSQITEYDIEEALERIGCDHSEISYGRPLHYWETEEEHFQRMSAPATEQSSIPQSNNGAGGGSGFWGFAAGAAAGAAKAVGSGIKSGGNFVFDRYDRMKKERLEEEYRDMQAKKEYSEKHGQEIADKIKELQEKRKIIEKDNSLTACVRLQEQLNCLSEEYVLQKTITAGASNIKSLNEKYKTLIDKTIKQFVIPKEEPELTDVLQYMAENARKTTNYEKLTDEEETADRWVGEAMFRRLEYLKALYPKHPAIKIYNSTSAKRKTRIILTVVGIVVLIVLYLTFLA